MTFFRVSHSVPDSAAMLIEAGGRRLIHSGDFKLDDDPPDGETTDREGIAAAVGEGVDLALVDSTNAERPGRSLSERVAGEGLRAAFAGRARADHPDDLLEPRRARRRRPPRPRSRRGRRVALLGRSMRAVAEIAERFGRLRLPAGSRPAASDLRAIPPGRLLCLTSGSQGEPFSALYRLALGEHADLELAEGDLVLLSARTIPGHERSVNRMSDHLVRRGARVVRESEPPIHVSGHAHRDEIAEWLRMVRPRAVMPVHGDRRMLAAAAEIAAGRGRRPRERVHLLDNGDRLTLGARRRSASSRRPWPAARSTSTTGPRPWTPRSCASAATSPRRASSSSSCRGDDGGRRLPRRRGRRRGSSRARSRRAARAVLARATREERARPRVAARRDRDRRQARLPARPRPAAGHRAGGRLTGAAMKRLPGALAVAVVARMAFHAVFLPAFEGPDEPYHLARVLAFARGPLPKAFAGAVVGRRRRRRPSGHTLLRPRSPPSRLSRSSGRPPARLRPLADDASAGRRARGAVVNTEDNQPPLSYFVAGLALRLARPELAARGRAAASAASSPSHSWPLAIFGPLRAAGARRGRRRSPWRVLLALLLPGASEALARASNDAAVFLWAALVARDARRGSRARAAVPCCCSPRARS